MDYNPILILANPKGNAWNFAKGVYEKLNSNENRKKRYQIGEINITKFSDRELFCKIKENVRERNCYLIHDSSMNPQDWLVSLILINDALMRSSAREINNVLPYMKYSRQDRMNEPRVPISASVLANVINSNDLVRRIITTDLHNPATTGSYKIPFDNLKAYPVLIQHLRKNYQDFLENAVLVSPDVGSAKRTESYGKRLGLDIAIINKQRKKNGKIEKMTLVGNVKDKNALIVDDMTDTSGTLIKGAELLYENGGKRVIASVTHGVLSGEAYENIKNSNLEKLIVTDSIPQKDNGKIEVVTLKNLIAETIFRITHGYSISEMFKEKNS